jgi:signal transduction histidine kinase/AmiR/NasT family two-component response regulator
MNNKLNLELAKEYYRLAITNSFGCYAMLISTAYFFWDKLPTIILLSWIGVVFFGATFVLITSRLFSCYATESSASKWLSFYTKLVVLTEVPWGLIGPISFLIGEEVYQMLTLFMLGGITATAIITRALIFKNYVISLFSLLTPMSVTLVLQGTTLAENMFTLVVIYIVFMLWVAKGYSANVNRNIQIWIDNEKLLAEVRISHAEIEETNQELTNEIEHRKKIESELIEAKERSERASEAKNQFLANVSHELRTPLNGIMGFAELLEQDVLIEKHRHYVSQINKAGKNLLCIVNDILDITSIEAGQVSLSEEPFSLRLEMEAIVDILRPIAERKRLMLSMCVDDEVRDWLYGDANRLRQVISNLLSNAVKYSETGFVSLTISELESRDNEVLLRFEVIDTGIGIAEDELNTIFDNFTRIENFETRQTEGTGLGLAIVKSLVKKMNGKLSVHSIPNEGSCFSFDLPLTICQNEQNKSVDSKISHVTPQQWEEFNVLVVDDNEINCILICAFLAKLGVPYAVASNGLEALEKIHHGQFDVVLMDIQMPGISGLDVANRLRAESAFMPILIAVTAHAFQEQHQAIFEAGFSDLVIKPVGMDELVKILTSAYSGEYSRFVVSEKIPLSKRVEVEATLRTV